MARTIVRRPADHNYVKLKDEGKEACSTMTRLWLPRSFSRAVSRSLVHRSSRVLNGEPCSLVSQVISDGWCQAIRLPFRYQRPDTGCFVMTSVETIPWSWLATRQTSQAIAYAHHMPLATERMLPRTFARPCREGRPRRTRIPECLKTTKRPWLHGPLR